MVACIFSLLPLSFAHAGWFGPDNYEDCVLEALKDSESDTETYIIRSVCRTKFPSEKLAPMDTKPSEQYVCEMSNYKERPPMTIMVDSAEKSMRIGGAEGKSFKITHSTDRKFWTETRKNVYFVYNKNYRGFTGKLTMVMLDSDDSNPEWLCKKGN